MPVWWYPSQVSRGMRKTPEVREPKTLPFESVPLTRKVVHIQPGKRELIGLMNECLHIDRGYVKMRNINTEAGENYGQYIG